MGMLKKMFDSVVICTFHDCQNRPNGNHLKIRYSEIAQITMLLTRLNLRLQKCKQSIL